MRGEVTSVSRTGFFVQIGNLSEFCIINNSYESEGNPVVGDFVGVEKREDRWIILRVMPRKNIIRRYDVERDRYQPFASNVGTVFVVTSANLEFSLSRLGRFLALLGGEDVRIVIVVTKIDLHEGEDDYVAMVKAMLAKGSEDFDYSNVKAVSINALKKAEVKKLLKYVDEGASALLLGSSGVGKSTIINTLLNLDLKTNEDKGMRHSNKGRHTTSSRTLYYLPCGKKIIDVPGIKVVGVNENE